jgi:H+-transporting ATPase
MDVLCADKTGTLTRNALTVATVVPMPGWVRERVVTLFGPRQQRGGSGSH